MTIDPCPFCGAKFGVKSGPLDFDGQEGEKPHQIYCWGCGAQSNLFATPEEALAAWNRRAAPAGPESLGVPQDAKSNPSNGLVERVARIVEPEAFRSVEDHIETARQSSRRLQLHPEGCEKIGRMNYESLETARLNALSKAREIDALYPQEGVLSSQRGEALESILAKLGVVETIMVNRGWHRQAVGGYLTDAGLWLDRAMSDLRKLVSHAEGENRSANASLRPGLLGPDTEVVGSGPTDDEAELCALIFDEVEASVGYVDGTPIAVLSDVKAAADAIMEAGFRKHASGEGRQALSGWQPIETAPRDGTSVLLTWPLNPERAWVGEGWHNQEDERWYEAGSHPTDATDGEVFPTHWMPLPSPPASPATPIGGLSLGVEGDHGSSVAESASTAQAPKSDRLAALVKSAAQIAYERSTDNDPLIHSNRFPSWGELSAEQRAEWLRKSEGGA